MTNTKPLTKKGTESTTKENLKYSDLTESEKYIFNRVDNILTDLVNINLSIDYESINRILKVLMNKYGGLR